MTASSVGTSAVVAQAAALALSSPQARSSGGTDPETGRRLKAALAQIASGNSYEAIEILRDLVASGIAAADDESCAVAAEAGLWWAVTWFGHDQHGLPGVPQHENCYQMLAGVARDMGVEHDIAVTCMVLAAASILNAGRDASSISSRMIRSEIDFFTENPVPIGPLMYILNSATGGLSATRRLIRAVNKYTPEAIKSRLRNRMAEQTRQYHELDLALQHQAHVTNFPSALSAGIALIDRVVNGRPLVVLLRSFAPEGATLNNCTVSYSVAESRLTDVLSSIGEDVPIVTINNPGVAVVLGDALPRLFVKDDWWLIAAHCLIAVADSVIIYVDEPSPSVLKELREAQELEALSKSIIIRPAAPDSPSMAEQFVSVALSDEVTRSFGLPPVRGLDEAEISDLEAELQEYAATLPSLILDDSTSAAKVQELIRPSWREVSAFQAASRFERMMMRGR